MKKQMPMMRLQVRVRTQVRGGEIPGCQAICFQQSRDRRQGGQENWANYVELNKCKCSCQNQEACDKVKEWGITMPT